MSQVPLEQVRQFLLGLFQKWGLPKAFRTDNGMPFGLPSRDAIPIMSLWLKGWGITPILNRPKHPQDNAQVERIQGTSSRWAEISKATDIIDLQTRLNIIIEEQRDKYPVKRLKYAYRTQVFKNLYEIKRPFDDLKFDLHAVYDFLSSKTLQRKVSTSGDVSVYGKRTHIHFKLKGTLVFFKFDPINTQWVVLNSNKDILKCIPDDRFSKENILLLTVCQ
jgi:transposase InsO family protein